MDSVRNAKTIPLGKISFIMKAERDAIIVKILQDIKDICECLQMGHTRVVSPQGGSNRQYIVCEESTDGCGAEGSTGTALGLPNKEELWD